ncbi:MAG: radical SAM protein [Candidatus Hodarchaeaceae archaeon]|nr:radical SAM protein [Candidatus Hodarchaeaceae archaeon]
MLEHVRVAFGTGAVLGIWRGQLAVAPTTAHFLTYYEGRCSANCRFCPQARESTADLKMLSRVIWPRFELEKVLAGLKENSNEFERVCIQAVNYPNVVGDLCELVERVKGACNLPISASCQPLGPGDIQRLADAGVERVSVALDAATPELFERVKGDSYTWEGHLRALENAQAIFGDRVSTHLIAGLGESEEGMVKTIQLLHDRGITIALFAFTPIIGTQLSGHTQPDIASYRRIQLARFLIVSDLSRAERMHFDGGRIVDFGVDGSVLNKTVDSGEPFRTSGCPGCNRPFYNESPRGPIYNYPRKPTSREIAVIREQLLGVTRSSP